MNTAGRYSAKPTALGSVIAKLELPERTDTTAEKQYPRSTSSCRVAASQALDRRWCPIPVIAGGKTPLVKWRKYQAARSTATEIKRWWRKHPHANLGLINGRVSGHVVLDVDGSAGERSIKGRHLPPTPTVRTPHGWHYYYAIPEGLYVPTIHSLLPGTDLQGEKSYVVAPPSRNERGAQYEWAPDLSPDDLALAPLPEWLREEILRRGLPAAPQEFQSESLLVEKRPLDDLWQGVMSGERNVAATRLVGAMLTDKLPQEEVWEQICEWNFRRNMPPLSLKELRGVFDSICRREAAKVHGPRVPRKLLKATISDGAKLLGAVLCYWWQQCGGPLSQRQLAGMLSCSDRTVRRWQAELKGAGLWELCRQKPSHRFAVVPPRLLLDRQLDPSAKVTGLVLAGFTDCYGEARIGLEKLSGHRGRSAKSAGKHLQQIAEAGHLAIISAPYVPQQGRRPRCNIYRVRGEFWDWHQQTQSQGGFPAPKRTETSHRQSGHRLPVSQSQSGYTKREPLGGGEGAATMTVDEWIVPVQGRPYKRSAAADGQSLTSPQRGSDEEAGDAKRATG